MCSTAQLPAAAGETSAFWDAGLGLLVTLPAYWGALAAALSASVVALSAEGEKSFAIAAYGAVFTWGEGDYGCLGHGDHLSNQLLPKKIEPWAPGQ